MASRRKDRDAAWVLRMGRHGVQVLAVVLVLALVFTMVNVQQFAAQGHPQYGVQWFIAWLLDPMASLTMAAAIVYEGLLADYGKPKVHWLTATKWYAGVATWGMNIWASAEAGSLAGVWLHSVAPGLVLLLAEAAPRVRRHMADIIDELETAAEVAAAPAPVEVAPAAPSYARVGPSSWSAPVVPAWASSSTSGAGADVGSLDVPRVVPEPRRVPVAPEVPQSATQSISTTEPPAGAVSAPARSERTGPAEVLIGVLEWRPAEVPVGVLEVRDSSGPVPVVNPNPEDGSADTVGGLDELSPKPLTNDEILPLLRRWLAEEAAEGRDVPKRQIMARFRITDHRARTLKKLAMPELVTAGVGNGNDSGPDVPEVGE